VLLATVEGGVEHDDDRLAEDRRRILSGLPHESMAESRCLVFVGAADDLLAMQMDDAEPS
jgi:hypothetical protein